MDDKSIVDNDCTVVVVVVVVVDIHILPNVHRIDVVVRTYLKTNSSIDSKNSKPDGCA
jgi:hypothetical protein